MQIRAFPPHYQLVYANFDIFSFSLISYTAKEPLLQGKSGSFALQNLRFRNVKSKLSFSFRIIFIKSGRFPYIVSKVSKDSKKTMFPIIPILLSVLLKAKAC